MSNAEARRNAAVLIDLESFYLARERKFRQGGLDEPYDFAEDLERLCVFTADLAGGRRRTVRRAYANFNVSRRSEGDPSRWDHYLQKTPALLMEQGIEPVQVFRFPGSGTESAVDLRLALDAGTLATDGGDVGLFVLVIGDADLVPLVLELERRGAEVAVIGVHDSTKLLVQRYCDRFEYFEDLLAASEVTGDGGGALDEARGALHRLLRRRRPMVFAAVKPLLSRELGRPFEPAAFGCADTGEFLRSNAERLGIAVRRRDDDWEIDVAAPRPPGERIVTLVPHSPNLYQSLLRSGYPRIYVVPGDDWLRITAAVHDYCVDESGRPRPVHHDEIVAAAIETSARSGVEHSERKVNAVVFLLFKSGCFECAEEGAAAGVTDFHWSHLARLRPAVTELDAMRRQGRRFLVETLRLRLRARPNTNGEVDLEPLVELLEGAEPEPDRRTAVETLLAGGAA